MKLLNTWGFVCVAAVLLPLSAHAQLIKGYGGKFGVNFSDAAVTTPDDFRWTKGRTGGNAAFFLEWNGSSYLSFVTQVEYAQRGFVEEVYQTDEVGPELLEDVRASTRLGYLSFPVMLIEARYKFDFTDNISSTPLRAKKRAFDVWFGIKL